MPDALDLDLNLSDATGDIASIERDLKVLRERLKEEIDEGAREVADEFRDEVKNQLRLSDIESDTGELMNSWRVRPRGIAHYEIYSTADHAVFLELGTRPHEISGNQWLKFIPSDISKYPRRNFSEDESGTVKGDYGRSGLVVSPLDPLYEGTATYFAKKVQHPGNKPYKFFDKAVKAKNWDERLEEVIGEKIEDLIDEFERGL